MNTMVRNVRSGGAAQRVLQTCIEALRALALAWQHRQRRRSALRELEALDDHMLQDIGLTRSELSSIVAETIGAAPATRRTVLQSAPRSGRQ